MNALDSPPLPDNEHTVARVVFVLSIGITAALFALPSLRFVAYPLLLLSTLAHEMGHGVAALLVGGDFISFELFSDGSGVAHTSGVASRLGSAIVSAGGLVGPAIAAAISFLAGRRPGPARAYLALLCLLCLVALLFVVRNLFGWFFIGGFAVVMAILVLKAGRRPSQIALVFLGTQLGLSVYSRGDYLFTDVANTAAGPMPSDVAAMAQALFLPYWFWGALCGGISVLALLIGAWAIWRR